MKKIIHWSFLYFPHLGGISTHIDSIVRNIPEYGFEVITNQIPGTSKVEKYSDNTQIKRIPPLDYVHFPPKWMKRKYSIPYGVYSEFLRTLKQKRYFQNADFDVLHMHETDKNIFNLDIFLNTNIFSKLSCMNYDLDKIKKPKLMTKHFMFAEGYLHPKFEEWERHSFNSFENIIFPTKYGYDKYTRYFESTNQEKNVYYIPNSVDTTYFNYNSLSNDSKLKIGCVARLSPEKGQEFLIEFLKKIPDDVDFYWACSGSEKMIENLIQIFDKPNIHIFPNFKYEKIHLFYHKFDLLLNSTMIIANDRVIPESMACGRPVIAIDVGEHCHVQQDKTGFLIQPDINELMQLINAIKDDRERLEKMGLNARTLIENKFSNEVIIPKIKKVYDQISE
ncbi:glycosyltransferase family 4 protein [Methanolobus sp. WCC4]|uniref:glycosyltransferase family 4 protein n=1 Tax=Methanolobus sp. WCC4 TaxID=3125784 RepID=UPI0030FC71C6